MTVNNKFLYNWQKPSKLDYVRYTKASPNLLALKDEVMKKFGGLNLGLGANKRPIRGGKLPSTHSFGAAWDWRYYGGREEGLKVMNWLVENSLELGIQAIHDYFGSRIWRSVRKGEPAGWKKIPKGSMPHMGASWAKYMHIETTKKDWNNGTPIFQREGVTPLKP